MKDVFISYSSKDAASAEYVLNTLESMYLSCWMAPHNIPAGENFADHIPSAIRNAKVFLILVSQNSQTSVQVQNELNFASHVGLPRFSIRLDDTPLNNSVQYHIPKENRYEGHGRLVAATSDLISRIHREIAKQSQEKQQSKQDMHATATMVCSLVTAGIAAILVCLSCIGLLMQLITPGAFFKTILRIIIIALLAVTLFHTPLFSEKTRFYQMVRKLIEALQNKA